MPFDTISLALISRAWPEPMDTKLEIVLTIGTGIAVALFMAYHKGAGAVTQGAPTMPAQPPVPPLDAVAHDAASAASGYNPGANIPNGFDFSPTYNIINNVSDVHYDMPGSQLVPLNVVNMSTGSPQCGCSAGARSSGPDEAYLKTLAAIAAIPPVQPTSNVTLTIQQPAGFTTITNEITKGVHWALNGLGVLTAYQTQQNRTYTAAG